MEKLTAVLDDAGAAPSVGGAPARIAALAKQHPDNIHLTTFDPAHFLGMSDDEKDMFCWCLSTDLSAFSSLAEASGDEKVEMPLAALACVAIALGLVAYYGKAAVMPVLVGAVLLSILSAFFGVSDGRSAGEEELAEEREVMCLSLNSLEFRP